MTALDSPFHNLLPGTDLVYVPRLAKPYARFGTKFFDRLLSPAELAYCNCNERQFLKRAAGRIAVKEATSKALGTGLNGLGWHQGVDWLEIEVIGQSQSPPGLALSGRALEVANGLKVRAWRVSLSHDGDYAMATVIGLI
jgi:holo-[acyl-carrier protein] synthase